MHDRRPTWTKRFAAIALSTALIVGGMALSTPVNAPEAQAAPAAQAAPVVVDIGREIKALGERMAKKPERLWTYAYEIGAMAAKDTSKRAQIATHVSELFDNDDPGVRLAAAILTLSLGDSGEALFEDAEIACREILEEGEGEGAILAQAARALIELDAEDYEATLEAIEVALEEGEDLDSETAVALLEAKLYFLDDDTDREVEIATLKKLTASKDEDMARHAALALARNGEYSLVAAKVAEIAAGAGEMASYARILVGNQETRAEIKAASSGNKDLVAESIVKVLHNYDGKSFYYNDENHELNVSNLLDNSYRAMASSLDRYSTVMTAEEYRKQQESNANSYAGIGAYVQKREEDEAIRISQPIYSGPAFRAGLRSGDLLWKAQLDGGEVISLKGMEVSEGVKILKGPVGTKIRLWVKRPGQEDLVRLELERARVQTDPSPYTMLPGDLGYVQLKHFGNQYTVQRFFLAMRDVVMVNKAKGVVLDLRDNPGGVLNTVSFIAGLMLPKRAKITEVRGLYPPYDGDGVLYRSRVREPFFKDVPLVVLINGSSASGSELLSGSMQDHKRATIIGEPSFGKGIGQSFYPITEEIEFDERGWPTDSGLKKEAKKKNGRILKSTIFDYYILPSGRSIDMYSATPSVRPDITVHNPILSSWEVKHVQALIKSEKLDTWVRNNWDKQVDTFLQLADYDGYTHESYPKFDELYESLDTELSKDRVRKLLRNVIRRFATDERAERFFEQIKKLPARDRESAEFRGEFLVDYQIDRQLQRAITELAKETKTDLSGVKEYAPFANK